MGNILMNTMQVLFLSITAKGVSIGFVEGPTSAKEFYRDVSRGPLRDYFSLCTSGTACSVISNGKEVWGNSELNTALVYSSSIYKKSLVCGFVTRLLDFSSGTLVERETSPSKIFKCVFSLGKDWVCLDGDNGQYIVYDLEKEEKVLSFESSLGANLQHMSDKGCAVISSEVVFCLDLNGLLKATIDLGKEDAGGLSVYKGGFKFTEGEAAGCSSYKDMMMVYSVSPLEVKIGDPISGVMKLEWKKEAVFGLGISRGDLRLGILIVPNGLNTKIFKVFNGEEVASIRTVHGFEFSEVEDQFYYVDFLDNIYKIGNLNYEVGFDNCQDYRIAIEECYKCLEGYDMIFLNGKGVSCKEKPKEPEEEEEEGSLLNSTGRYFLSNEYLVESSSTLDLIFVQLTQFYNQSEEDRLEYVGKTFGGRLNSFILLSHLDDSSWKMEDFVNFELVSSESMWKEGRLPVTVGYKRSVESFLGNFFLAKNSSDNSSLRILQANSDSNSSTIFIPSYWKMSQNFQNFFMILFDLVKLVMTLLQLFLILIRPFWKKFHPEKYNYLSKPITNYYILLAIGSVPGKYGGFIDQIQLQQLRSLQKIFFIDPQVIISEEFYSKFTVSSLAKFRVSDYSPSILQENMLEVVLITLGLVFLGFSLKFKKLGAASSRLQFGLLLSFVLPLGLTTGVTVFSIILGGFVNSFSFISFGLSVLILSFYLRILKRRAMRKVFIDFLICIFLGFFCNLVILSTLLTSILVGVQIWMARRESRQAKADPEGILRQKLRDVETLDFSMKLASVLLLALLSFLMPIFTLMQVQISTFFVAILTLLNTLVILYELWLCFKLTRQTKSKEKKDKPVTLDQEIAEARVGDERQEVEIIKTDRRKNYEIDLKKRNTDDDELKTQTAQKSSVRTFSDYFDKTSRHDKQGAEKDGVVFEAPDVDSGKYVSRGTMTNRK